MGISFRTALLSALSTQGRSLEELSEAANVPVQTLSTVLANENARISVPEAERIAAVFGSSLDRFLEAPEVAGHIEIARLYSALPPLLKAQLEAYGQEPPADEDQPR